jgi:hypothetical protein
MSRKPPMPVAAAQTSNPWHFKIFTNRIETAGSSSITKILGFVSMREVCSIGAFMGVFFGAKTEARK